MSRRTLLKLLGLLPIAGPAIAELLIKPGCQPVIVSTYFPSHYPKWDKLVDGLECVGKWASDIERSQLPGNMLFPRAGQIWEAVQDCEVAFRPCIAFPNSESQGTAHLRLLQASPGLIMGATVRVRKGEKIRILETDDPKPLLIDCVPLCYDEMHERIVPVETRNLPGYSGYKLHLKTARTIADLCQEGSRTFLNEAFKLVHETN